MAKQKKQLKPWQNWLAGFIIATIMRLLYYTGRKQFIGAANIQRFFNSGEPLILAAWHNRNVLSCFNYLKFRPRGRKLHPLASLSKDGSLADSAFRHMGFDPVRGSTGKGGVAALRQMIRLTKKKEDLAFTPDGPTGPKYEVTDGVLLASRTTGAWIVPITFDARWKKELNTWDKLIVPRLFSRLRFVIGEPILVPRDGDMDEYREKLRLELMRICDVAANFEGSV